MKQGLLEGNFKITNSLIDKYREAYGSGKEKTSNTKQNTRLAILNLLKYKRRNGIPVKDIPEGWIYVVTNPAWRGFCKIGKTIDKKERIATMQTYSPLRDYKVEHYMYFNNALQIEKEIHNKLKDFRAEGEWFNISTEYAHRAISSVG